MRKLMLVVTMALALSGCAAIQKIEDTFDLATTPVTVTSRMQFDAENALKIASAGLVTYRRLCLKKAIDPVTRQCRAVIETIQPYTIAAKETIIELRAALKANDQVTAVTVYKNLQNLIANIQTERQKAGVN